MGFTHYWHRKKDFTTEQWSKIHKDTLDIVVKHCDKNRIPLAQEYDAPMLKSGPTPPICNSTTIQFNGWREDGHETFFMARKKPDPQPWQKGDESFDFCKTARKPYDLAVCLVLLSCVHHAPEAIRLGSDGDWDSDWLEARKVFKELFGVEAACPFEYTVGTGI